MIVAAQVIHAKSMVVSCRDARPDFMIAAAEQTHDRLPSLEPCASFASTEA